jgi:hypothetical protein
MFSIFHSFFLVDLGEIWENVPHVGEQNPQVSLLASTGVVATQKFSFFDW